jgi:hypothetical protein
MKLEVVNNEISGSASDYFKSVFEKAGYTLTGKSVKIDPEYRAFNLDRTSAGNFAALKNSATMPLASNFDPFYVGDLRIKTFVQAFTSGSFDKQHSLAYVAGGVSYLVKEGIKTAIIAVESGNPNEVGFLETKYNDILFWDVVQNFLAGAAPVGTLRSEVVFVGHKISLI